MAKSRTEKREVEKDTDWGAWFLVMVVVVIGVFAYNYESIGDKWTKVLEIVGSPFALGLGLIAFEKASDKMNEYKERVKQDNGRF